MAEPLSSTVHVWQVDLEEQGWDRFAEALSNDEQARAERYATSLLAQHFRRCRAALRTLLGRYCDCAPDDLAFEYTVFGKPALARASALHFNVSHSASKALIAIANAPVGIDIESLHHRGVNVDELVDLVCHAQEREALAALPVEHQPSWFYRLWTKKEAYCKARGAGLQFSLPSIRFRSSGPGKPEAADDELAASALWWVYELPATSDHVASLCLPHAGATVVHRVATPTPLDSKRDVFALRSGRRM